MITIRKSGARGQADRGWLQSQFTFSFADYHDPNFIGFRALRVMNEDHIAPGQGFGPHADRDMEIITFVMKGTLRHRDSMSGSHTLGPDEIQTMSAGNGIVHSEVNGSDTEPVHLMQIYSRCRFSSRAACARGGLRRAKIEIGSMYLFLQSPGTYAPALVISAHGGIGRGKTADKKVPFGTLHWYSKHGDTTTDFGIRNFIWGGKAGQRTESTPTGQPYYDYSLSKYQGRHAGTRGEPAETYAGIEGD
jgi:hypothetical protein